METEANIKTAIEIICKKYYPLTDACKDKIAECAKLVNPGRLTTLVREGQYSDKTFFLIQGTARSYYLKDGKDVSDWFAFEGEFFCSINSVFLDEPSLLCIETLEQSYLLELTKENMFMLCDKYPDFDRLCRIIATWGMLQLQQRLISMQFETAYQKFENLLKIRPGILQKVPLTHIASYLGITLETLSRIRNPRRII